MEWGRQEGGREKGKEEEKERERENQKKSGVLFYTEYVENIKMYFK